jgi:hypothetical protein
LQSQDHFRLKNLKELNERRTAAAEARKLLLKKFETAPKASDPEMIAKRAEREAIVAAREARKAERERLAAEENERKRAEAEAIVKAAAAEAEARAAATAAAAEALEAEAKNRIARVVMDEAERKAERDRRYAARKAKNR